MTEITFSDVELTLIADSINRRVTVLDAEYQRLRVLADEADAYSLVAREMETNRIYRAHLASIVRRMEQRLDVAKADVLLAVGA